MVSILISFKGITHKRKSTLPWTTHGPELDHMATPSRNVVISWTVICSLKFGNSIAKNRRREWILGDNT